MSPGVSGMVNFSSDIWFTGRAARSNVWFGVLSQLRHTQYRELLKKHSGFDLSSHSASLPSPPCRRKPPRNAIADHLSTLPSLLGCFLKRLTLAKVFFLAVLCLASHNT